MEENNEIKKLESELDSLSDEERIQAFGKLSREYLKISLEKALEYCQMLYDLAKKLNREEDSVYALVRFGYIYMLMGKNERAIDILNEAYSASEAIENRIVMADSLYYISTVYKRLGYNELALDYAHRALKIGIELDDESWLPLYYNNVGAIHKRLGNYDSALENSLNALRYLEKSGSSDNMATTMNDIGIIYDQLGENDRSMDYYRSALKLWEEADNDHGLALTLMNIGSHFLTIDKQEKAMDYFNQSMEIKKRIDDKWGIALCLNNIGVAYERSNEYEKALDYHRKALAMKRKIGDQNAIIASLINIGKTHSKLGQFENALESLSRAQEIAVRNKSKSLLRDVHKALAEIYTEQGYYKEGFDSFVEYSKAKDQIFSEESSRRIAEMRIKYETDKKEKEAEIYRLKNVELARANETIRRKNDELTDAYEKLEILASTDPLTGLSNRRETLRTISEGVNRYDNDGVPFTLIISDIDNFKRFNDLYGHDCGDLVLSSVAKIMDSMIDDGCCVGRWGGEEFLIYLCDFDLEKGFELAERIREKIGSSEYIYNGQKLSVTMTFGVSEFDGSMDIDRCIMLADQALYEGKESGRNCVVKSLPDSEL